MNDATLSSQDLVYALAASPDFRQDGILFAARAHGLFRSTDSGQTWTAVLQSEKPGEPVMVTSLAISPDFTHDRTVFASLPGGVISSQDGGETWQAAVLPTPIPVVSALALSPNFLQDGALFTATTQDGVFLSTNRGASFVVWNFGLIDSNVFCLAVSPDFANDRKLYAGTESAIYVSRNGGRSWRELNLPTELAPVISLALSPDASSETALLAGTEFSGLFMSADGGKTWRPSGYDGAQGPVNCVLVSAQYPLEADILILTPLSLLLSRDNGQTWQEQTRPEGWPAELSTALAPEGLDPGCRVLVGLSSGDVVACAIH